jgi:anhydro-N-acetylmuramic acid kinase
MAETRTILSLYCGPSVDATDAALLTLEADGVDGTFTLVGSLQRPLPPELRDALRVGRRAEGTRRLIVQEMTAAARSALELRAGAGAGPSLIAVETDLPGWASVERPGLAAMAETFSAPAVGGFAATDRMLGGVGSGATAWGLWRLMGDEELSRVVVRLGAAAHLTFLPAGGQPSDVLSWDVAPGQAWLDAAAEEFLDRSMDRDGTAAARGQADGQLVHRLVNEGWFRDAGPAELDLAEWRQLHWPRAKMMAERAGVCGDDLLACLAEATATALEQAIGGLTERPHQVILCGGGALNIHLASRIRARLSPSSTIPADKLGIPARAVASAAVGVMAAARLEGISAHCPAATGAGARGMLGTLALPRRT